MPSETFIFLVEELEVLQHKRHGMVLLTNLQRSFLLCSSTWGYKGQKFTIWRPSRHQQRRRWPHVSCCRRGIGARSTGKKVAGAPCRSDLSCEGSARRRGAGRRRRWSRDEEEQDGAEVVVADAPPSIGDPRCSASWEVGGAMARRRRWRLYVYVNSTIISSHNSGCQLNLASPNKTIVELRPDKKE